MSYLQALLMGIIQGLTEFLPVSSSAHIVIASNLYKFFTNSELAQAGGAGEAFFDIILHFGTLVAILIYFRKDLIEIFKEFYFALKNKDFTSATDNAKLPVYIALGTVATLFVVFPLKDLTEQLLSKPSVVSLLLVITGIVLFLSEFISKKYANKNIKLTLKKSIIVGIAQGLAIFPGISRSGSTIATAMFLGLDRVKAARYSFLLSIPIILGASLVYPILELPKAEASDIPSLGVLFVGFISSLIVGFLCIKYFIKFLQKFSMKAFAWYCCIVGLLMFILFSFVINVE